MIGVAFKQAVLTLVERKISYTVLAKLRNKTSDSFIGTIITQQALLTQIVERLTLGNRKEFAEHKRVDVSINSTTYFVDPFACWQQGKNEDFNGLLRQ